MAAVSQMSAWPTAPASPTPISGRSPQLADLSLMSAPQKARFRVLEGLIEYGWDLLGRRSPPCGKEYDANL